MPIWEASEVGEKRMERDAVKRRIPLKEGLFQIPSGPNEKPRLIAGKCPRCGVVLFPRGPVCPDCQEGSLETIFIEGPGTLYTFTSVLQRPSVFYKGEIPYFLGYVELPEGIRIRTLLTGVGATRLLPGMDMELVLEKLHDDEEGNEVITYKFRPLRPAE